MNSDVGFRIIVEGPECVGKDTFIKKLKTAIDEKVIGTKYTTNKKTRKKPNGKNFLKGKSKRYVKRITAANVDFPAKLGSFISTFVIEFRDNCRETREFYEKMHAGVLSQRAIAEEFLQVHYDNELYTRENENIHDVVIMNRALSSYKANQIIGDGFSEFEEKWQKLVNHSYEDDALFILLKAPGDVIKERLLAREKEDYRGAIEQHFAAKHEAISTFYQEEINSGRFKSTLEFDTTSTDEQLQEFINKVISLILAERTLAKNKTNNPFEVEEPTTVSYSE